jgi:hypothetical protein
LWYFWRCGATDIGTRRVRVGFGVVTVATPPWPLPWVAGGMRAARRPAGVGPGVELDHGRRPTSASTTTMPAPSATARRTATGDDGRRRAGRGAAPGA